MVLPRTATPSDPSLILTALCAMSSNVLPDTVRFLACTTSTAMPGTPVKLFDDISAPTVCTARENAPILIAVRGSSGTPS